MDKTFSIIEDFKSKFEKTKVYPFSKEGILKMELDTKLDGYDKYISGAFYAVIAILLIQGIIGKQFICTYIAGSIGSNTVKYFMR